MVIRYKDKEYTLSPISLEKRLEHLAYLKASVMNEVKAHMVGLPLELCKHVWDEGRKEANAISIGSPNYLPACCTFDALAKALQLAVNEKDFTLKNAIEELGKDLDSIGPAILHDVLGFKAN